MEIKNLSSVPVGDEVEELDLDMVDEIESDTLGLPTLEELGLGEDEGLGRAGRRRRRKASRRRKGARARRAGGRRRRRSRKGAKMTKADIRRAARRRAKTMPRSKKGRFLKISGSRRRRRHAMAGLEGFGVEDMIAEETGLGMGEDEEGLGRARRRKKSRRARRKGARARRGRGRRRSRRSRGLAGLADASAALADAEVMSSTPVLGLFQWIGTRAGLEALGGAAVAPVVSSLVKGGLFGKLIKMDTNTMIGDLAASLTSAVVTWELGKLVGSGNLAKFGAFSILSQLLNRQVIQPYVMKTLGLGYLGDDAILFPGKRRGDYAVNPLSGIGTVRVPDDQSIGQVRLFENQDLVGLGTVRVPDQEPIGTVRVPDDQSIGQSEDDEAEVGQFEDEMAESSEVF